MLTLSNVHERGRFVGQTSLLLDGIVYQNRGLNGWSATGNNPGRFRPLGDKANAALKIKYFGDPAADRVLLVWNSMLPEYSTREHLDEYRKVLLGIVFVLTGKIPEIYRTLTGTQIRTKQDGEQAFVKAWEDLNKICAESADVLRSIADNFKNEDSTDTTGRVWELLQLGRIRDKSLHMSVSNIINRIKKRNIKLINPWTREIDEIKAPIPKLRTQSSFSLEDFKEMCAAQDEKKLHRYKAAPLTFNEPMRWTSTPISDHYPPLPILDSDQPLRPFSKDRKSGIFLMMGVELEVNVVGTTQRDQFMTFNEAPKLLRDVTSKWPIVPMNDGSISGVEFIGPPGTLAAQKLMWKDVLSIINSYDFVETGSNTGLHVHVSRQVFTPLTLNKMLHFVNNPDNSYFVDRVAGRPPIDGQTNKWRSQKFTDNLKALNNRHYAVNILNRGTVEFRLFGATLDFHLFAARLEFVDAAIRWVFSESPSVRMLKPDKFRDYVRRNRHSYPELSAFIKREMP